MGDKTQGQCSSWTAVHDFSSPKSPTIRVSGKCMFPQPGYKVILKRHVPQGAQAEILLLDKHVLEPREPKPDAATTVHALYDELTKRYYKEVKIVPDNVTIKVQVAT